MGLICIWFRKMSSSDFDKVLFPIARELSHCADEILDLREAALQRNDPGRCLSCYFKILGGSRHTTAHLTNPLRQWLEQHLEVVACGPSLSELERLPIQLPPEASVGIEAFCRQIMTAFREDRTYQNLPLIELSFQFKQSASIA
ncbi:MAG: hypothetical protein ACI9A1_000618 [Lentimonas sp.]|jgi:hypothetical protein